MAATNWVLTIRKHGKTCKVMTHKSTTVPIVNTTSFDTVEWRNRSHGRAVVFFPHENVLGNTPNVPLMFEIPDGGSSGVIPVPPAGSSQSLRYGIWCDSTDDWAIGNSDPEIIIEA